MAREREAFARVRADTGAYDHDSDARVRGPMAIRLLGWWAVLFVTYLLLVSSATPAEVVAGAAAAAVACVVPAVAIRGFGPWAPPTGLRWRHLVSLPWDLARDTAALAARLATSARHAGRSEEIELPPIGKHAAVRAYAVLALSLTPGSYVGDVREGERSVGRARVHRLGQPGAGDRMVGGQRVDER